ncbi:MAG TPA: LysR family transcriptional regulator [Candidatus Aquabacterium excrementipullorum]|nr:LysR family transcriptional regulator [Candidatus Aquabacterium excrementipullorum]
MTNTSRAERFDRLDLNLLLTLDVLLKELNVTRAAERLHLSQPSVSAQLARLRDHFADPLLLPGPRGMRPTARALALRAPLSEALASLADAVAPAQGFDAAKATHTWRIAAADYGEMAILAPLILRLREVAPHTRLAVIPLDTKRLARQAESGEIDVALHTSHDAPPGLRQRTLLEERYVLVGRSDHPRLRRRPSLAQFCALSHVIVSPGGGGFQGATDLALQALGLRRQVVLSVPHFLFALDTVRRTDLVAMLPSRLVQQAEGLRVVEPPLPVAGYEMAMLWHEAVHRDPVQAWLRGQIVAGLQV